MNYSTCFDMDEKQCRVKTIPEDYKYEENAVWKLKMQTLELDWLGVEFWLHFLLDVCPYISLLSSLFLSFFISHMIVVIRLKWFSIYELPIKQYGAI